MRVDSSIHDSWIRSSAPYALRLSATKVAWQCSGSSPAARRGWVPAGELASALGLKQNTLSVYVAILTRAGLLRQRRQGRSILYSIDLDRVGALIDFLVTDCCRGRPELCEPLAAHALRRLEEGNRMSERVINVLFICTGNSARSIMAEAILNHHGARRFRAFSAGTRPRPEPNPHALAVLRQIGRDVSDLRSKSLDEFHGPDSPTMDFVFTVCDQAANEECPVWPGHPISAHWGMPDPAKVEGSDAEKALAFREAYSMLRHRLAGFVALPMASLDRISLQKRIDEIGREQDTAEQKAI